MSFFDAFRSFLGIPPKSDRSQNQHNFWHRTPEVDDDDFDFHDGGNRGYSNPNEDIFSFRMFSGDILEMHRFFEQQFDDIVKNFQSNWFSDGFSHNYGMLAPPDQEDSNSNESNPRNKFLKPSYINPSSSGSKPDPSEIDNEINEKIPPSRILDLFPDKGDSRVTNFPRHDQIQPYPSTSHFSSQVIKKKILPNGGVEEERKCIRDGKEEIKISRELKGMKHIVTTIKLPDGTSQMHEEFINLDEDQLSSFNKAWSGNNSLPGSSFKANDVELNTHVSLADLMKRFF